MPTRQEFADALTAAATTTPLSGSPFRPAVPGEGAGWPLRTAFTRDAETTAFTRTWLIFVIVPQDEQAASLWLDDNVAALYAAIHPLAYVEVIEPVMVGTDEGDLYAVRITARSE